MEPQTLNTAAKDCADRLLSEPEVKNYISRILRIAFMEGCVWSKEQQLAEMKTKLSTPITVEVADNARS